MLLQTNSYIVPADRKADHARLIRRFRQTLNRIGCDQFEVYEQVGPNWSPGSSGRYVQIMRFRDRQHQLAVQAAERNDPGSQQIIAEFCDLINFPYQQQHGYFATSFYTSVLPVGPRQLVEYPQDEIVDAGVGEEAAVVEGIGQEAEETGEYQAIDDESAVVEVEEAAEEEQVADEASAMTEAEFAEGAAEVAGEEIQDELNAADEAEMPEGNGELHEEEVTGDAVAVAESEFGEHGAGVAEDEVAEIAGEATDETIAEHAVEAGGLIDEETVEDAGAIGGAEIATDAGEVIDEEIAEDAGAIDGAEIAGDAGEVIDGEIAEDAAAIDGAEIADDAGEVIDEEVAEDAGAIDGAEIAGDVIDEEIAEDAGAITDEELAAEAGEVIPEEMAAEEEQSRTDQADHVAGASADDVEALSHSQKVERDAIAAGELLPDDVTEEVQSAREAPSTGLAEEEVGGWPKEQMNLPTAFSEEVAAEEDGASDTDAGSLASFLDSLTDEDLQAHETVGAGAIEDDGPVEKPLAVSESGFAEARIPTAEPNGLVTADEFAPAVTAEDDMGDSLVDRLTGLEAEDLTDDPIHDRAALLHDEFDPERALAEDMGLIFDDEEPTPGELDPESGTNHADDAAEKSAPMIEFEEFLAELENPAADPGRRAH